MKVLGKTGPRRATAVRVMRGLLDIHWIHRPAGGDLCFLENGGSSYNSVVVTQQMLTQMRAAQIL